MGYWPSKIPCILNVILQVGWGIIASIIAGQSRALSTSSVPVQAVLIRALYEQMACFLNFTPRTLITSRDVFTSGNANSIMY